LAALSYPTHLTYLTYLTTLFINQS